EIQEAVQNAFSAQLAPLPADPNEIPEENLQILPFELPIKQKSQTKAIVAGLHRLYNFDQLPEKYFVTLDPVPKSIHELHPEVKDLFPITQRNQLNNLAYYKKKLQDYYTCDSIPSSYFDLPPPKKPLPLAYQDLSSKYRLYFPIDLQDPDTDLTQIIQLLREEFTFRNLPNDYIKVKPSLPKNTNKIRTPDIFTFLITENQLAKKFIDQITPVYKFSLPLPPNIMT